MTTEKMTVHKALAELKVLDDRILVAIGACNLITTKKNNQDNNRTQLYSRHILIQRKPENRQYYTVLFQNENL